MIWRAFVKSLLLEMASKTGRAQPLDLRATQTILFNVSFSFTVRLQNHTVIAMVRTLSIQHG